MSTATMERSQGNEEHSVADLMLAINTGDSSAWDAIVQRYSGLVIATVRSFRLPEADTLDAVQSTWMRLVENHHRVRSPEYLGGWLVTTARRECLRILRHAKRISDTSSVVIDSVDPSPGPEQQAVSALTAQTVRELVAELTPRQRCVITALFLEDRPFSEISRITGIPQGSIGPTRMRALALLRRLMQERGLHN